VCSAHQLPRLKQQFTTKSQSTRHRIDIKLVSGPFRAWRGAGCLPAFGKGLQGGIELALRIFERIPGEDGRACVHHSRTVSWTRLCARRHALRQRMSGNRRRCRIRSASTAGDAQDRAPEGSTLADAIGRAAWRGISGNRFDARRNLRETGRGRCNTARPRSRRNLSAASDRPEEVRRARAARKRAKG